MKIKSEDIPITCPRFWINDLNGNGSRPGIFPDPPKLLIDFRKSAQKFD
jgi:hypothetical protein